MKRRQFLALVASLLAARPSRSLAQAVQRVHRIGFLVPVPASAFVPWFDELRRLGFVEGENLTVDRRGFDAAYAQFPIIAADLAAAGVDAIICGGDAAIRAAQTATTTIPIIASTDDMVGAGLAPSLARPGGNTTGVSLLANDLDGKRQEILFDLFPGARLMAMLADTRTATSHGQQTIRDAAHSRDVEIAIYRVDRKQEIAAAITAAKAAGAVALNVLASPLLHGNRLTIIEQTNRLRLPAIFQWPDTAEEGGLLGYGPRFSEFLRQWAQQAAKVLRGAKPADLPISQPTRFELVINLKTATAIGFKVPPAFISRADQAIE